LGSYENGIAYIEKFSYSSSTRKRYHLVFSELHKGQLDLFRINFGEIILFPKAIEAERIQQYIPNCLLRPRLAVLDYRVLSQVFWVILAWIGMFSAESVADP
jgi:hypothetical protein